jgi:hypothetical protein
MGQRVSQFCGTVHCAASAGFGLVRTSRAGLALCARTARAVSFARGTARAHGSAPQVARVWARARAPQRLHAASPALPDLGPRGAIGQRGSLATRKGARSRAQFPRSIAVRVLPALASVRQCPRRCLCCPCHRAARARSRARAGLAGNTRWMAGRVGADRAAGPQRVARDPRPYWRREASEPGARGSQRVSARPGEANGSHPTAGAQIASRHPDRADRAPSAVRPMGRLLGP